MNVCKQLMEKEREMTHRPKMQAKKAIIVSTLGTIKEKTQWNYTLGTNFIQRQVFIKILEITS